MIGLSFSGSFAVGLRVGLSTSFKYLASAVTDEGSKPDILSRIAQATATLTRLKPL